jgi:2-methylcitrate dehydratase PrpD
MEKEQLTRKIARYVAQTRPEEIPPQIYEHAKVAFLDWLGVTLAGKEEPLVHKLLKYTDLLGGKEQATILGHGVKRNVSSAALVNGAASHALDYDDTLRLFLGHPSVTLFPGVLAWAEWQGKTGKDFLQAYLVGFEVGARIGACAGNEHYLAGWHATSTIGRMASAAACSKLMGLDEQQTLYALGIAGTQTCGLKRVFGTMCKPLHAGAASQGGLMAAMLAAEGFDSADDILEGPQGFFQAFHGQPNDVVATLGKKWEIEGVGSEISCVLSFHPLTDRGGPRDRGPREARRAHHSVRPGRGLPSRARDRGQTRTGYRARGEIQP